LVYASKMSVRAVRRCRGVPLIEVAVSRDSRVVDSTTRGKSQERHAQDQEHQETDEHRVPVLTNRRTSVYKRQRVGSASRGRPEIVSSGVVDRLTVSRNVAPSSEATACRTPAAA